MKHKLNYEEITVDILKAKGSQCKAFDTYAPKERGEYHLGTIPQKRGTMRNDGTENV